jgi:2-methylcitrate dehydratase PrpD
MANLTRELGAFVAQLTFEQIPQEALTVIHTGFSDCVGVMLAGRVEPVTRLLRQVLAPAAGPATLLFGSATAPGPEAAWINGVAAHALDFDDVALRGHPSTVLVPAILAEAQAVGATGRDMVVAYAAGYEVWADLSRRDPDQHHNKGWHPTGIFGAIGAAAACASLRKLTAEQSAVAIALGASQSAGIMANFGTMTKPFHAGRSAHSGVIAARLAQAGFTASLDALEHAQGFMAAVSPAGRVDVTAEVEAGKIWKLSTVKLSIKKYPLCFCTHRALDGMLDLMAERSIEPANVERITVSTSRRNATMLRNRHPQTGLEAKFSMQFAIASAIIARRAGLTELTDEFVQRPDVQALMRKVDVVPDDREDPALPGYAPYDLVTVLLTDGSTVESRRVVAVRGGPDIPLSRDDLWVKFEDCARVGGLEVSACALFDAFMALEDVPHVRDIPGITAK